MPIDSSIPFQSMAPDPMVSLNSMLDVGSKSLSLAKNRATFDADVARSKAESSTAQSGAEVNRANINPLIRQQAAQTLSAQSKAQVDQANVNPLIQQQAAQTANAQTGAQNSAVDLNTKKTQNAAQALQALMNSPALNAQGNQYDPAKAAAAIKTISAYAIETGQDPSRVNPTADRMLDASDKEGGSLQVLRGIVQSMLTPHESATIGNPNIQTTDSGNTIYSRDNNPNSRTFSGNPTATVTKQLPPTQENIGPNNEKSVIGAVPPSQGGMGAQPPANSAPPSGLPPTLRDEAISRAKSDLSKIEQEASNPQKRNPVQMQALNEAYSRAQTELKQAQAMPAGDPRFPNAIATGMKPGQGESIAATQKGINDHYRGLQDGAASSAQDIGVLQNIMSHAKGASTGIGSEKAAIAQAIFGKLGITKAQESSVDYDMLAKSSAMLALAGGNTDAAKSLATAANPNSHMSEEAIRQAAQQIIAQKKMTLEGLKIFQPLKDMSDRGHPEAYNAMMPKFATNADPKTIEFNSMTGPQREQFKKSMSPEKQKAFRAQMLMMESMGVKLHE